MTQKVYKTAQGKTIDMGSLALQNENVRLRKEIDKSSLMGKKCRTKKSKSKHC